MTLTLEHFADLPCLGDDCKSPVTAYLVMPDEPVADAVDIIYLHQCTRTLVNTE